MSLSGMPTFNRMADERLPERLSDGVHRGRGRPMLDAITLRVAFIVVALTLLSLSFLVTYRSTRSAYSLWWSVGLALLLAGNTAFILNGTPQEAWANPLGNALGVAGGASLWAATRSLRGLWTRPWTLAFAPALVGAA